MHQLEDSEHLRAWPPHGQGQGDGAVGTRGIVGRGGLWFLSWVPAGGWRPRWVVKEPVPPTPSPVSSHPAASIFSLREIQLQKDPGYRSLAFQAPGRACVPPLVRGSPGGPRSSSPAGTHPRELARGGAEPSCQAPSAIPWQQPWPRYLLSGNTEPFRQSPLGQFFP